MIRSIYVYGNDILREECKEIDDTYEGLDSLIEDMFETMAAANGVGLAAPQIGLNIRLFVCDVSTFYSDAEDLAEVGQGAETEPYRRVFINPEIVGRSQDEDLYLEGCLSLPGINENVMRPTNIILRYFDENFVQHTSIFDTMWARVIQHEYDHIEGKVFTDRVAPLRRQLLRSKLQGLTRGNYNAEYKTK